MSQEKIIENIVSKLDENGNATNSDDLAVLQIVACSEKSHTEQGYAANEGRGRCIRKDGSFDYLKMSKLYHEGKW